MAPPLSLSRKDAVPLSEAPQPFQLLHQAARGCPKRRVASGTMAGSPPQGMLPAAWQDVLGGNRECRQGGSSPQGRPELPIALPQGGSGKPRLSFPSSYGSEN